MSLLEQQLQAMPRDSIDVFHQLHRVFENVVIDALMNVAQALARDVIPGAVGVIDVTRAVGIGVHEVGTHVKECGNVTKIVHRKKFRLE
jgi:type IV secretory pathway TrbL component